MASPSMIIIAVALTAAVILVQNPMVLALEGTTTFVTIAILHPLSQRIDGARVVLCSLLHLQAFLPIAHLHKNLRHLSKRDTNGRTCCGWLSTVQEMFDVFITDLLCTEPMRVLGVSTHCCTSGLETFFASVLLGTLLHASI